MESGEKNVYGAVNEEGRRTTRINNGTEQTLENENIVKYIKSCRIRRLGRVERMDEARMPKRVMLARTEGTMRRGRPRSKWMK